MVFSTNSDLFYIYLQYKSEKSHGLSGLGWKSQEHTVIRKKVFVLPGKTNDNSNIEIKISDRHGHPDEPDAHVRRPLWLPELVSLAR